MADYTGAKAYEPLQISEFETGYLPGIAFNSSPYAAFRFYTFAPSLNTGNRPTSGQLYPRGFK